jgi:hypothetical protein
MYGLSQNDKENYDFVYLKNHSSNNNKTTSAIISAFGMSVTYQSMRRDDLDESPPYLSP